MRRQLSILLLLISGLLMSSGNFTSPNQLLPGSSTVSAAAQNPPFENLALGRPASQSSTDIVNGIVMSASRAVDGNTNGNFSGQSISQTLTELRPWWQVDLGAIGLIDTIEIFNRTDCCAGETRQYYVLVSDVPFESSELEPTRNHPEVSSYLGSFISGGPSIFALQHTGRYVRVQMSGEIHKSLHLAEVRVLGNPLSTHPRTVGQWSRMLPDLHDGPPNQLSIVHLSLLPNGKLLFWGRDKGLDRGPGSIDDVDGGCNTYLWDLSMVDNLATTQDERLTLIRNNRTNLFCSAHSFLPNGNLFVVGGDENPIDHEGDVRYELDGHGVKHTNIFNYANGTWSAGPTMNERRWYPSVVTLENGETLIMTGSFVRDFDGDQPVPAQNRDTEILDRNLNLRLTLNGMPVSLPNYPYAHVGPGPDGKVFVVSGRDKNGLTYTPSTNFWDDQLPPDLKDLKESHNEGTSVMYDKGKIMVIGGRQGGFVTNETETIDIDPETSPNPSWSPGSPMYFQRYYATSVLMPNGQVFVVGGSKCGGINNIRNPDLHVCSNGAIMNPEIYDPTTRIWSIMARQTTLRMYHSVALLLPDARILVAGGGRPGAFGENGVLAMDKFVAHREVEIFSPPYLFKTNGELATRPTISSNPPASSPQIINYGQSFNVTVGNVPADQIDKAVLVRLPSVTHTLNFDQRRVVLPRPTVLNQQTLSITAPADGKECPPGPYMLFVSGQDNVPSEAMIILVNQAPTATLTVTSNPTSGVGITVSPSDNNSQDNGVTPFTRTYNRNTTVTLSAPPTAGGNTFSAWQRDGTHFSSSSNVSVVMDANHTMTAVYVVPPTATLNVTQDLSTGINIAVSPSDNSGQGNGAIPFTRTYNRNTTVTLTAPAAVGSSYFQYWLRDGLGFSNNHTVTITMDANHTMTPAYRVQPPLGFRGRSHVGLASQGAVASASSTFSSAFPASAVNNGDRKGINWGNGGVWMDGTADSYPDWIQIDFGRTVRVDEVDIFTVQDNFLGPIEPTPNMTFSLSGITSYDVQYWDGTSWSTPRRVTSNNYVGRVFMFGTVATTKIRVVINNALQSHSRITEIEVYSYIVSSP